MHVEPTQHAPQTLKEFGIHYLMIVVGILTAVGIEQGLEALHNHELAKQAIEQIDVELRSNLDQASTTLAGNEKRLARLRTLQADLVSDVQKNDTSPATFKTRLDALEVGVLTPALRRDAWDAAIADQALTHVDADTVRRYSAAYSAQKDVTATILVTFTTGNWMGGLKSAMVDAKLGQVDQVGLLKALATYDLALSAATENERELTEALKESIGTPATASGARR